MQKTEEIMAIKKFFNDLFSTPAADDQDNVEVEETEETAAPEEPETAPETKAKPAPRRQPTGVKPGSSSLELKICKPQSFSEVGTIADHLINRCTVVLNLETTSKESARRIVDFLNGVAYSIDGQIKPVANNTFVITPKTVSVTGEENEEAPQEPESEEDSSFANF